MFFILIFVAFACLVLLIGAFLNYVPGRDIDEVERERAGKLGELQAYKYISKVLIEDDVVLRNVKFTYNNQECEIDFVVVNRFGVFIIEAKYYSGYIEGDEDKKTWSKTKVTSSGNTYVKEFSSPLKQLNWHIDSLAKYLRDNKIFIWIKGYSLIINNEHSQIDSDQILHNTKEIDTVIHTKAIENKYELSKRKIDKIIGVISSG